MIRHFVEWSSNTMWFDLSPTSKNTFSLKRKGFTMCQFIFCGRKHSFIIAYHTRFELDFYNLYDITPFNVLLCKKHVKQCANAPLDKFGKTFWKIPRGILVLYSGHIHCGYALWSLQWASNTRKHVFQMRKRLLAYDNAVHNYSQSFKILNLF